MNDQPSAPERRPLTVEAAAALREYAAGQRARTERFTEVLEDIAANGLPRAEDCTPWEAIRDRRLAEIAGRRGHAA
ncbi:hypothetical protein ACIGXM_11630 [Kitasatospora sp. NPDC052896]|uniref:hypothetical protein n=1 Tax=Kitasatospora sp. NPDC052896 TaxID=3364061 RepID=UPI0037C8ED55